MSSQIDPSSITPDNIPAILGAILVEIRDIKADQREIKTVLDEHTDCLEVFKFSKCKLVPWISRNKYVMAVIFGTLSVWISSLDWINRWLQWAFFPPIGGKP